MLFRYCTLHNIFGTPLYAINGIQDMGLNTYDQWAKTLDGLLEQAGSDSRFFR